MEDCVTLSTNESEGGISMEFFKVNGKINSGKLALSILVPTLGGSLAGTFANRNTQEEYAELKKPSFFPPPWIFPVAWTALYTSMGVAKYRAAQKAALKTRKRKCLCPIICNWA